jgi:hypothetical protein
MKKAVGFDQKILLHQLDFIAREIPRTESRQELYEKVDEFLTADIAGFKSRLNARTILFKIWYLVEQEYNSLQQDALKLIEEVYPEERKVIHWGMTLLAYPFFADMVNELGTMFKLQDEVPSEQITRRIKALYGDRRRVEVSISATMTSLREWKTVVSEKRNIQKLPEHREIIRSPQLQQWISEILLRVLEVSSLPVEQFNNHPLLFPFILDITTDDLDKNRFNIIRQGVDMRMVSLKN